MLYIISIDDYTVKFHDNGANSQIYGKNLVARADSLGRIWITDKDRNMNVLNSCLFSNISLHDGVGYNTYLGAEQLVTKLNLMFNSLSVVDTTTTTSTEAATTTTTGASTTTTTVEPATTTTTAGAATTTTTEVGTTTTTEPVTTTTTT